VKLSVLKNLTIANPVSSNKNKHEEGAIVTHLPASRLKGNINFPLSGLNNAQLADLVSRFPQENNLR